MVGATDLRSLPDRKLDKNFKSPDSESGFEKELDQKLSAKPRQETAESPPKEMRSEKEKPQPDGKAEQKVAKTEGKIEKKATVRQKAIQEFMDSFESEFEISPTRLVEAMAQLDDSELLKSPEATAEAVIAELGLDESQEQKAQAMYVSLLTQLQQLPPEAKAPVFQAGGSAAIQNMQLRYEAAQDKQNVMGASVDQLNKKFWMSPQAPVSSEMVSPMEESLPDRMLGKEVISESPSLVEAEMPLRTVDKFPELPPHLKGQMKETASPALLAALAAKKAEMAQAQAQAQSQGALETANSVETSGLLKEFSQALQSPKPITPDVASKPALLNVEPASAANVLAEQMPTEAFMQNSNENMQQGAQQGAQQGEGKDLAQEKLMAKANEFKAIGGFESMLQAQPIKAESMNLNGLAGTSGIAANVATPGENQASVQQLMNQAQYLIKKGGGEVKVEMTPEGMGKVHLKVMVQDGKVNLQMAAETQDAKKTIESSLAELKTSLAAHKLSVENVKVDVVNSTSTDTAANNQSNMNGQNQRDQTRQFWNQFNENFGNQGRRESFAEMSHLKGYGQKRRDPLQPIEVASTAPSRASEGKGSGLNLVA